VRPTRRGRWLFLLTRGSFIAYVIALFTATHWPNLEIDVPLERPDLLAHAGAFGLFTALLLATGWLGRPLSARAILLATVAGVCVSAVNEASQGLPQVRRTVDPSDLWANLVGVGIVTVGAAVLAVVVRLRRGPRQDNTPSAVHDPAEETEQTFLTHARTFAVLTMGSRVLGLARDAVIAGVLGASAVASSFFTAFVIPNVFRRLFGEGALTAAFIPEYTRLSRDDPGAAARFASLTTAALTVLLGSFVILVEIALGIVLMTLSPESSSHDVVVLTMVMLPFMPLVCVTALLGAMLQVHGRFAAQAGAPIILNALLITAATSTGIILGWSMPSIAMALAVAVTVAGVLQLLWCLLDLQGIAGWTRDTTDARPRLMRMLRQMIPVLIGLGTVQIGVLIDAVIAGLPVVMGTPEGERLVLGGEGGLEYPLDTASAAVLYFGQRLYQLPLGVFAVAIATAVFPALSRAADSPERFRATLRFGLRTSLFIAVPSAVGLALVAGPLVRAVYGTGGGEANTAGLSPDDAARVWFVLLAYTPAIIAASITQVLTRAFYACDDMRTPMRIGVVIVGCNIVLNLLLIWPFAEAGLAIATSITAWGQTLALAIYSRRRLHTLRVDGGKPAPLLDAGVFRSVALTLSTTGAMALVVLGVGLLWTLDTSTRAGSAALLGAQVASGGGAFLLICILLKRPEAMALIRRNPRGMNGKESPR